MISRTVKLFHDVINSFFDVMKFDVMACMKLLCLIVRLEGVFVSCKLLLPIPLLDVTQFSEQILSILAWQVGHQKIGWNNTHLNEYHHLDC
jgi:hypothetical protein